MFELLKAHLSRHLLDQHFLSFLHIVKRDRCCNLSLDRPLSHLPHTHASNRHADVAEVILDTWTVEWWLVNISRLPEVTTSAACHPGCITGLAETRPWVRTRRFSRKFDCSAYYQWPHGETPLPHFPYLSLRLQHRSSIIQTQCHSASSTDFDQA